MKFSILDAFSINPGDLSWKQLEDICDFIPYDRTEDQEIPAHIGRL